MIEKLENLVQGFNNLLLKMSEPEVISNIPEYTKLAKEHSLKPSTIETICKKG